MTLKINNVDCEVRGIFQLITARRTARPAALRGLKEIVPLNKWERPDPLEPNSRYAAERISW